MKTFRYRIYPTKSQQEYLEKCFGCVRFVYNRGLGLSKDKYSSYYDLAKQLTKLKQENKWMYECPVQSQQQSLKQLDTTFKRFFKKQGGYPKFKKKSNKQTIHYNTNVYIKEGRVKIPKVGYIKCKLHMECKGKIKNATLTKTASGKYYVSIVTDCTERKPSGVGKVGIDMGIKEFAILSDGTVYHNPKYLKKSQKKLNRLRRQLSKKQKGSSNRDKARLRLARQYEKVYNQRLDFQHKVSREIANKYGFVAMEKLGIKGMMKNHKLAYSICDAGWYMFKTLLSYKTKVVEIDQYEPSSKTCSNCGNIKGTLGLNERTYYCDVCGHVEDRDVNAAKNILAIALALKF